MVYYNEFDEPTAWWLKGLSDNGVIPKGFVDVAKRYKWGRPYV